MSNPSYIVDNDVYEYARQTAKSRASNQWLSGNFNLWDTYNTTLNTSWVDPWYEHETVGVTNESPTWQQTVNLYFCYCWFKFHGYSDYALTGILATFIHESTITGGEWEGGYHPYPGATEYSSLIGYNASSTSPAAANDVSYNALTWYTAGGSMVPQWTSAPVTDEVDGQDYVKIAPAGSWYAVRRYEILFHYDDFGRVVVDNKPNCSWDTTRQGQGGYKGKGGGYGLAQWTPWTKLPTLAAHFGTDASNHWQLNPTLQLMIIEYQRELSANGQAGAEWTDGGARSAVLIVGANRISYGSDMTWEYFISDQWLLWVEAQFAYYGITDTTQIEWGKRQFAIALWGACYEHGGEYDYSHIGFEQISLYVYSAIRYWETNGGYDIHDVPRARDIEYCDLDQYHISTPVMVQIIGKRRKKHHVRTLLL